MAQGDIKGGKVYELRVGDSKVPYSLGIPICSSATANDGSFPYGTSFDSVDSFIIKNRAGTDVTSTMLEGSATITDGVLGFDLNHGGLAAGRYTIIATINFTVAAVARKKTIYDESKIRVY